MCGIAGIIGVKSDRQEITHSMLDLIKHRGPDEIGYYHSSEADLGVCRLSIVDLELNKQPMNFSKYNFVISLNGEIYNLRELQKLVNQSGIELKTKGDTEVIGHLYFMYGEKFIKLINGMFAISIWDEKKKVLLLYRDRTGQKPMYFAAEPEKFIAYASEIKSLLNVVQNNNVNFDNLNSMLVLGYIIPPGTPFEEIFALEPAHYLRWEAGLISKVRYWSSLDNELPIPNNFNEIYEAVFELIRHSTKLTLASERPLCVLLSGGIDSTVISHFAQTNYNSLGSLKTVSLSVGTPEFDETSFAIDSSRLTGTSHYSFKFDPDPNVLSEYLNKYADIPFADSSVILMYQLTKFMSENNLIVGLTGDGGDELFGGYSKYNLFLTYAKLKPFIKLGHMAIPYLGQKNIAQNNNKFRKYFETSPTLSEDYIKFNSLIGSNLTKFIWEKGIQENINFDNIRLLFTNFWNKLNSESLLNNQLLFDQNTYLPGDINYKSDTASSANGVELRSPFQDHLLIGFVNNLPSQLKINNQRTKYLLRHLLKNLYPDYILNRKKFGFGFDRATLIRTNYKDFIHDSLLSDSAKSRGWFDSHMIKKLLTAHSQGEDFSNVIWPLFIIENWAQNWLDRK